MSNPTTLSPEEVRATLALRAARLASMSAHSVYMRACQNGGSVSQIREAEREMNDAAHRRDDALKALLALFAPQSTKATP